ncbi:MAG: galactokinase family protein [Clostridiales bacterium]|nr:galactokinase family protein [Clostridiales bacterium]
MLKKEEVISKLSKGELDDSLKYLYVSSDVDLYRDRYMSVINGYEEIFGKADEIALFSAPGRTEIGGNHTDHQHGCVIAGSVNLDVIAAVSLNNENVVRIKSKGYPMDEINLDDLEINEKEYDKAISLIRGVIKRITELGYEVKGFNAYTESNVMKGSGLSSSAAFEVLVGTIINHLFANAEISPVEIAKIGQFAENVYYNKPSGLLDQMASSVGAVVAVDFKDNDAPVVKKVDFDLSSFNHSLCIIDSGADHADLTNEYAAVTEEMRLVSEFFGKKYLREVSRDEFFNKLKDIRKAVNNDRAILRAIHYFNDSDRAVAETEAIEKGDFKEFCKLNRESGRSSFMYLQNVYASSMPKAQAVSLTIALCEEILGDKGSFRVHGGGFAGTVQAFVPNDMVDEFKSRIEAVLGEGMCHILSIRPVGGYRLV